MVSMAPGFRLTGPTGPQKLMPLPGQPGRVDEEYCWPPGIRIVTRGLVRAAHKRGLRIDVWTIDEEADMRRLLEWGVDGIMSDRPDILARVLDHTSS